MNKQQQLRMVEDFIGDQFAALFDKFPDVVFYDDVLTIKGKVNNESLVVGVEVQSLSGEPVPDHVLLYAVKKALEKLQSAKTEWWLVLRWTSDQYALHIATTDTGKPPALPDNAQHIVKLCKSESDAKQARYKVQKLLLALSKQDELKTCTIDADGLTWNNIPIVNRRAFNEFLSIYESV